MTNSRRCLPNLQGMLCILLAMLFILCPLATRADSEYGVVQGGMLNLRATPSENGQWLGSYPTGTWVQILEQGTNWHKVLVDGQTGYMSARYVKLEQVTTITDAQVSGANGYINLRQSPSQQARVITTFSNGTRVKILSHENGWYHVSSGNYVGYLVDYLVRLDNPVENTYAVIQTQYGSNLNLRAGPSYDSRVLASYSPGQRVEILLRGDEWTKVRVGSLTGYMATRYLTNSGSSTVRYGVVNNPRDTQVLNLRETASLDAKVLAYYRNGTQVEILEMGNTWYKVRVGSLTGYMMGQYIKLTSGSAPSVPFTAWLKNPNGGSVVNFRAQPGLSTRVLGTYPIGTQVTVLNLGTDWSVVKIGDTTGYISTYFLRY